MLLAIQDWGAIWESGEHFDQKFYADLSNFGICRDLCTFETIFRLNVGNISDDWGILGNIDSKVLLFGCIFPIIFYLAVTGELNSVQQCENYAVLSLRLFDTIYAL